MLGRSVGEAAKLLGYSILVAVLLFAATFNRDKASNAFLGLVLIGALACAIQFTRLWGLKGFAAFLGVYCLPALGILAIVGALLAANADRHFGWECSGRPLVQMGLSLACRH